MQRYGHYSPCILAIKAKCGTYSIWTCHFASVETSNLIYLEYPVSCPLCPLPPPHIIDRTIILKRICLLNTSIIQNSKEHTMSLEDYPVGQVTRTWTPKSFMSPGQILGSSASCQKAPRWRKHISIALCCAIAGSMSFSPRSPIHETNHWHTGTTKWLVGKSVNHRLLSWKWDNCARYPDIVSYT